MRTSAGAMLLLPIAFAFGAEVPLPKLNSPAALEAFFFPAAEEDIFDSMQAVFRLENPGVLVTAVANAGPEYATKVAATIASPEFRRHYAVLAKYLELFGPCQRKQKLDADGWWSAYTVYPGDAYCGEAAKLVFAAALWSQVHYCQQLSTGEVKAKFGASPAHDPPFRLDEAPVATHWLIAGAAYAVTDAAVAMRFEQALRRRAADASESEAMLDAAIELEREPVNRERAALSLLKMMLRTYENVHLRHLNRLPKPPL